MAEGEISLYYAIAGGKVSLQQLVSDWVEEYKTDQVLAMVHLVQLFFDASGCSGQVTLEMIETKEQGEMINLLADSLTRRCMAWPAAIP